MPQIGTFGDVVFQVSDSLVRTLRDYNRSTEARLANHDIIGKKPITEFIGPGADSITFTIQLNILLGVNPKNEADKIRTMVSTGQTAYLVLGGKPVSQNKFILESMKENVGAMDGRGNILNSSLDLTMHEYIDNRR